jgi:hypothetical protein
VLEATFASSATHAIPNTARENFERKVEIIIAAGHG